MSITRLILALLMSILATSIQAETINCTPITALPATITTQGIYCLTHKLGTNMTSGTAITINANNVTIDLNGWKVDDGAAGSGTVATGIYSNYDNVTIKNGIVRGFSVGIRLRGSGDVVQDVRADTNYYVSLWFDGPGALAEHNQVVNSGNSSASISNAWGIYAGGNGTTISDNIVSGVTAEGGATAYGIVYNSIGGTVRNNVVNNASLPASGSSYGIYNGGGSIVTNNSVNIFSTGIFNSGGIYSFNTVNGCPTAFSGGTAGVGNSND
ncbi:MAG: right-handed parallel beta-helix repeat-containing protein [Gammaproteobacteria bacterium]